MFFENFEVVEVLKSELFIYLKFLEILGVKFNGIDIFGKKFLKVLIYFGRLFFFWKFWKIVVW